MNTAAEEINLLNAAVTGQHHLGGARGIGGLLKGVFPLFLWSFLGRVAAQKKLVLDKVLLREEYCPAQDSRPYEDHISAFNFLKTPSKPHIWCNSIIQTTHFALLSATRLKAFLAVIWQ